jgi:predicted N-formylglutamate amidohydrolase
MPPARPAEQESFAAAEEPGTLDGACRLLGPGDPPPVVLLNPEGRSPALVLCDHADSAVPRSLGRLGLEEKDFAGHIAYDIGAAGVTRLLSRRFDARAVLSGYSRLVIDINRGLDDPTSIPEISDGVIVPANRGLPPEAARARVDALFRPYHDKVAAEIERMLAEGRVPAVVSIHSFTPVMNGFERPWHVGILWDRDERMARPLLERLAEDADLVVGDNEPYTGRDAGGSTLDRHCRARGLPHVLIELRQDLIASPEGQAEWAGRIGDALDGILSDPAIHVMEPI